MRAQRLGIIVIVLLLSVSAGVATGWTVPLLSDFLTSINASYVLVNAVNRWRPEPCIVYTNYWDFYRSHP